MPIIDFIIPEIDTYVINPITDYVIQYVLRDLNVHHLFNDKANIYVSGHNREPSSASDKNTNIQLRDDACRVIQTSIMNPKNLRWECMSFDNNQSSRVSHEHRPNYKPIFNDPLADIELIEHFTPCTLALEFTLQFMTIEHARMAEMAINNKYLNESTHNSIDLTYHYPLGYSILQVFVLLYRMRKSIHPEAKNFLEYFEKYAKRKLAFMFRPEDMAKGPLCVRRTNLRALGLLEYTQDQPEAIKLEKSTEYYELKFNYTLQFACPNSLRLYVPVTVENQLIPEEIVPNKEPPFSLLALHGELREKSFNTFLSKYQNYPRNLSMDIRLPFWNDFNVPKCSLTDRKFSPFFISTVLFEEDADVTHIDLADLGDLSLHPIVLEIIKEHGNDVFSTRGLFNISIFANRSLMIDNSVSMDGSMLTIRTNDVRYRHNLVISEATEFKYIDNKYVRLMMKYRWFFATMINRNIRHLVDNGIFKLENNNIVHNVMERCMRMGNMDKYLQSLISLGHAKKEIYMYATTAWQLMSYCMDTLSPITKRPLIFELREIGKRTGCLKSISVPDNILTNKDGYPFSSSTAGGLYGITTPLRVLETSLIALSGENAC